MKIDIFCHIVPKPFYDRMVSAPSTGAMQKRVRGIPVLHDLDLRFRMMDSFQPYQQVFSIATPPVEVWAGPDESPDLARMANDLMAELVHKYPDRFPNFVACVALNNPDAALRELDRALVDLDAAGVQLFSNINGKAVDAPEFAPLFQRVAELDRAIWLHPWRGPDVADYPGEARSRHEMWWVFGWPYETSVAMSRIVFAGYFDRYPDLKVIAHHGGAMIPQFSGRIGPGLDQLGARTPDEEKVLHQHQLKTRPYDYFKMFYIDTCMFGAPHAVQCCLDFFGIEKTLFASDMPFDPERGPGYIRETIRDLQQVNLSDDERRLIYEGNAKRLLKLKVPV
jgi:uncharacterized protein